jgi:hypothetical protein
MAWTNTKTAAVTGVMLVLAIGITIVSVKKKAGNQMPSPANLVKKIEKASSGLPPDQIQAKKLIMFAFARKKIPEAANWCEDLNTDGKLWPTTPSSTLFAINREVTGRTLGPGLPEDLVVFFESAESGWNQAGGPEMLAKNPNGVAVAFANGQAVIVPADQVGTLHWKP